MLGKIIIFITLIKMFILSDPLQAMQGLVINYNDISADLIFFEVLRKTLLHYLN